MFVHRLFRPARHGGPKDPHDSQSAAHDRRTDMTNRTRRSFLTDVAIAGAGLTIVPRHVLGRGFTAPSDMLNVAAVGVGGQGRSNLINLASENVVSLCDVDWDYADKGFASLDADIKNQQDRLDLTAPRVDAQGRAEAPLTASDRERMSMSIAR